MSHLSSSDVTHLRSSSGNVQVDIVHVGAGIQRLVVPDREGIGGDIVLGCDDVGMYERGETPYFGVIVGRVANRIARGTFELEGVTYSLAQNNGPNCLHGGEVGFSRATWKRMSNPEDDERHVTLELVSEDGEDGFPSSVVVSVSYDLADDGSSLTVSMKGKNTGDISTLLNLAGHSYFNLGGHDSGDCLNHELQLPHAEYFTPVDDTQIPTGEIVRVDTVPSMDFRESKKIGKDIDATPGGAGYDHNFVLHGFGETVAEHVLKGVAKEDPGLAAILYDPSSGRGLRVFTTAPGVQLYSGNFLDGTVRGKGGARYQKYGGICLETQGFPDAINHKNFPSIVFRPGEEYCHVVKYEFFTE